MNEIINKEQEDAFVPLTVDFFKKVMSKGRSHTITQALVDRINAIVTDPDEAKQFRDNLISFASVLEDGKIPMDGYIQAVNYISFKLRGLTNFQAYIRTFPDRYQAMLAKGYDQARIKGAVRSYDHNKIVNAVREQSLIPTWVLNADIYQEAINTQYELMREAKSERVRMMAADSLLAHLKRPEAIKQADLTIDIKSSGLEDLRNSLVKLAEEQKALIQQGTVTTKQVAELDIIDAEVVGDSTT